MLSPFVYTVPFSTPTVGPDIHSYTSQYFQSEVPILQDTYCPSPVFLLTSATKNPIPENSKRKTTHVSPFPQPQKQPSITRKSFQPARTTSQPLFQPPQRSQNPPTITHCQSSRSYNNSHAARSNSSMALLRSPSACAVGSGEGQRGSTALQIAHLPSSYWMLLEKAECTNKVVLAGR